jgi:hypothetical protein
MSYKILTAVLNNPRNSTICIYDSNNNLLLLSEKIK